MAAVPPLLLVGRDRELGILRQQLDAALAGRGGLVLISGEAGIGKTSLAEQLCRGAAEQHILVLTGRCYDLTATPPFGPWIELFGRYEHHDDVPPLPEAFAGRSSVAGVASQAALFQQVREFFIALAASRPLVLLLEDLHWADPASLDLLRFLGRLIVTMPVLIIATYRADELTRRHPLYTLLPVLVRETSAARIELQRLDKTDLHTLITARYSLPDAEAERLVTYIQARSEGNPFFADELLHTLEAEHVLHRDATGSTLGDLSRIRTPMLLRQVVDGRLARLNVETHRLLAIAAVIGQDVPIRIWTIVADVDDDTLAAAADAGIDTHLIAVSADGTSMYFVHALIREALYESVTPVRRGAWHRRVAEVLLTAPAADPDAVAYHLRRAEDPRAAEWLIKAGERAERAYAWLTAIARYEAALALIGAGVPDNEERGWLLLRMAWMRRHSDPLRALIELEDAERLAVELVNRPLIFFARFSRGQCSINTGAYTRGLAELTSALTLLADLTQEERDRVHRHRELSRGFDLQDTRLLFLAWTGRFAEVQQAATLATERVNIPSVLASLVSGDHHLGAGLTRAMLADPDGADELLAAAHTAFVMSAHHYMAGVAAYNRLRLSLLVFFPERIDDRRRVANEGEQSWRFASDAALSLPPILARAPLMIIEGDWHTAYETVLAGSASPWPVLQRHFATSLLGPLAAAMGMPTMAWNQVREMFPAGPETPPGDLPLPYALVMQQLAVNLALTEDDKHTAQMWLMAHDRWLTWSGAILGQSEGAALWARYHRMGGDLEAAFTHAHEALLLATRPRQPLALLAAHRLLGELDTDAGRYDAAARHVDASLALADACQAPYERALTLLARAELCAAQGSRDDAMASLDAARAICAPRGAAPALGRADALAARLAATPDAAPAGLSVREVEVLRLLAGGQTNREIAAALFLSEHTVRSHVRSILTKTRSANRTGAALFAHEHDLG